MKYLIIAFCLILNGTAVAEDEFVLVDKSDKKMSEAFKKAKSTLGSFLELVDKGRDENSIYGAYIKFEDQGETEYIWVTDVQKYDDKYVVIPNQYHKGKSWEEFIRDYRHSVEELGCKFTIIDSINMLDPSKLNTVDNLNALKTYNHEKGITCVVIGQVKDTGQPQGGEALFHTSEVALHISEISMTSKAQAETWGSQYREKITVINARSKVCYTIDFPVRIEFDDKGMIRADSRQPANHVFPAKFWE